MGRFAHGDVFQRSKRLSLDVINFARKMPRNAVLGHLGLQLLRSATSIGANLAEADMAETNKDFRNKVNIATKEACESVYWISLIKESGIIADCKLDEFSRKAHELQKICRRIVQTTGRNSK